jgi:hypothetical protein
MISTMSSYKVVLVVPRKFGMIRLVRSTLAQ